MLICALEVPRSLSLYLNQSRNECIRVIWENQDDGGLLRTLEELRLRFGIEYETNHQRLTVFIPATKARIILVGADRLEDVQKLRGPAYDLVIVDEAQKVRHLKRLAEDALFPGLMRKRGRIKLIGTPAENCAGIFFEVTRSDGKARPGWSVHRWSFLDNEAIPDRFEIIDRLKEENGWDDDNETLLREYKGLWVQSASNLVYKLAATPEERRYYDGVLDPNSEWLYLVGCDLGYDPDPWAYVVWAYREIEDALYEVESWKEAGLDTEDQAKILLALLEKYEPIRMVADAGGGGSAKQIVEGDYRGRFGLPIEPADKHEKDAAREAFNTDMGRGRIKLVEGSPLDCEMLVLPWWDQSRRRRASQVADLKRVEDPRFHKHCCDAALYAYRASTFYRVEEPPSPGQTGEEWRGERPARHRDRLRERARRLAGDGDGDYGEEYGW